MEGLKEVYETVMDNCVWTISNGKKINFWRDNWAGESLSSKYKIQGRFHPNLTLKIVDCWNNDEQNLHDNIFMAMPDLLETISPFSVSEMDREDSLAWKSVENGILSIKQAYTFITKHASNYWWTKFPWDKDTSLAHSMIVLRLLHN